MKTSTKRLLAIILSAVLVIGAAVSFFVLNTSADGDTSWTSPQAHFEGGELTKITVEGVDYPYGRYYEYATNDPEVSGFENEDYLIPGTGLEMVLYGYGTVNNPSRFTFGIIIRIKADSTSDNYSIPDDWHGYDVLADTVKEVYIEDGITEIGEGVFKENSSLKKVFLGSDVKTISRKAFYNCYALTAINLGNVEVVENEAFYECKELTAVNLQNAKTVGASAFRLCTKISGVVNIATNNGIAGVTVGDYAFYECSQITELNLATGAEGTTLASVGVNAFREIGQLTTVNIGNGPSNENRGEIKALAFYNNNNLVTLTVGDNFNLLDRCFCEEDKMTTATFGDNITFGDRAVSWNYRLVSPTFGDNIVIGTQAFRYDLSLKELDLTNVSSIGNYAFADCYHTSYTANGLKTVTVSDKLTSIGTGAFRDAQMLESINLCDASITVIPNYAFEHTGLKSVVIPKEVKSIGSFAFSAYLSSNSYYTTGTVSGGTATGSACSHIKSVTFEEGSALESIGSYAFYRQSLSGGLNLPENCTSVDNYAFYAAGTIGEVTLGSKTTMTVGTHAMSASGISKLTVEALNEFTTSSYAFYSNPVASVVINTTGTVTLGEYAFYQHRYLTSVLIKADNITVKDYAFYIADGNRSSSPYNTLAEVTLYGSKVTVKPYAFSNNRNLATLNMPYMEDKDNLTLGTNAFGSSIESAYYNSDALMPVIDIATGEQHYISVRTGMTITLKNMDASGPLSKFINNVNYYSGQNYSLTYESQQYPTCTQRGYVRYIMTDGGSSQTYWYYSYIEPLGHMYGESEIHDADCIHGELYYQCCERGQVNPNYGVDGQGYAIDANGQRITAQCTEKGYVKTQFTRLENALGHEYYAGTLYQKTGVLITESAYTGLDDSKKADYHVRYSNDGGTTLIHEVEYNALADTDGYVKYYYGTDYLTAYEYAAQSSPEGYTPIQTGFVSIGDNDGTVTVEINGVPVTYTTPFTGYTPIYISYDCYRANHAEVSGMVKPYSIGYVPTNLTGNTDQKLKDIYLGINNLDWKNPEESLAGNAGDRTFTAVYIPDGNGVDSFKPVEIQVHIMVSRVEMSLESLTFTNTRQSTAVAKVAVGTHNLPAGLTPGTTSFFDDSHESVSWEYICGLESPFNGTVEYTFTFDNDIYNLVAVAGTPSTYWIDGVYNESGINDESEFTATASQYGIVSVSAPAADGTVTVTISHAFVLQQPSLNIVTAEGDVVVYNGEKHGFTLANVPAGTTINVTQWTTDGTTEGQAVTDGYTYSETLSAPGEGLTVYSDLRTVDIKQAAENAGTYYFKVVLSNGGYSSAGGTEYTLYVTTVIKKQTIYKPIGSIYVYDGTVKTGVTLDENSHFVIADGGAEYTNTGINANQYTVLLRTENANYKWNGVDESVDTVEVTWRISKRTVAVPTVDDACKTLDYNGTYQTPLVFDAIDTVAEGNTPEIGDYKFVREGTEVVVSAYIFNATTGICEWVEVYELYNAYGLNVPSGTGYTITGNYRPNSGLFDTENFQWPNQVTTLNLGTWNINRAEIALPTLTLPSAEYTGAAYDKTPVFGGSWDFVNEDGVKAFELQSGMSLVYTYYNGIGNGAPIAGVPSNVGLYTVKVSVKGALNDTNYKITGDGVISASFQITKAQITMVDADPAEHTYNGQPVTLPAPTFRNSSGDTVELSNGVTLRYYAAIKTVTPVVDEQGTPVYEEDGVTQKVIVTYTITDEAGTTSNIITGNVGQYVYLVGIDTACDNYESVNYAAVEVTVVKATQGISVEKRNPSSPVTLDGLALTGRVGYTAETIYIKGDVDVTSPLIIRYNGVDYTTGTSFITLDGAVAVKVVRLGTGGTELTVAFLDATVNAIQLSISTDGTENAGFATCNLIITSDKAKASVAVTPTLRAATDVYTGNSVYTFETVPTGVNVYDLAGNGTPLAITTGGTYNNCKLYFFNNEENANDASQNGISDATYETEPVNVGTYWIVAKYLGDDNYAESYSAPVQFTISRATLTITGVADITQDYNGINIGIIPNIVVTGNGNTLSANALPTLTDGQYYTEFYPSSSATEPAADSEDWSADAASVKNYGDSGKYWFRIITNNYVTYVGSVSVTVNKLSVTVVSGMATSKVYDGDNAVINGTGDKSWTVYATAVNGKDATLVASEITEITVTGTYGAGKIAHKNGSVTINYVIIGSADFLAENYIVNGSELTSASFTGTATATITKAPLTVSSGLTAEARAYNGTTSVAIGGTSIELTGVIAADIGKVGAALIANAAGSISSANASTTAYDVTITVNQFTLSGDEADNYEITDVYKPTVVISKADSTIAFNDATLEAVYTGTTLAAGEYAVTVSGVTGYAPTLGINNEYVTFEFKKGGSVVAVPTNAGTYTVKATYAGDTNYNGSSTAEVTIEIKTAALTVNASGYTGTYDAVTHNVGTFTVTGLSQTIDDYTLKVLFAGITDPNKTAEEIAQLTGFTEKTVKNAADSGYYYYEISKENFTTYYGYVNATVNKQNLTIDKGTTLVVSKTYDGTTAATVGTISVTGAVGSETVTAVASAAYNTAYVLTANQITVTYTMTFADGALESNYTYTAGTTAAAAFADGTATETVTGTDVKITPLAITVSGVTATNRVYNGTASVALVTSGAELSGVLAGDASSVSINNIPTSGTVESADADTASKTVTVEWTSVTLQGDRASDYTVTGGNSVTVVISKANPIFVAPEHNSAGYSKVQVESIYYYVTVKANDAAGTVIATGDSATVSYMFYTNEGHTAGETSVPPTDKGTYYIIATFAGDGNHVSDTFEYTLTITETGIEKAKSGANGYSAVYDGLAHGVIASATVFSDLKEDDENVNITDIAKIYVIEKATSGESKPATDDTNWVLAYSDGVATSEMVIKDAGTKQYWVKLTADNHESYVMDTAITVTVTKATLTVSSTVTKTRVYDATKTAATSGAAVTGQKNGENITVTATSEYGDKNVGTNKSIVTTYVLTFTGCSADNYVVKDAGGNTLTGTSNTYTTQISDGSITAKDITIGNVKAQNKDYDNSNLVDLYVAEGSPLTITGLCTGDTVTADLVANAREDADSVIPGVRTVAVATTMIVLDGADKGNYNISSVASTTVTINKKQLSVSYGGTSHTLGDVTYDGDAITATDYASAETTGKVIGGADVAATVYTFWKDAACETAAVGTDSSTAPTKAGTYYIKATVADNDYYLGAYAVASIEIENATLTVNETAYSGTYDGQTHAPATFTVTGVKGALTASEYTVVFVKSDSKPAADAAIWTASAVSTVLNHADGGKYYFRITAENYDTEINYVTVEINRVAIDVESTVTNVEKVYDASTSVAITSGSVALKSKTGIDADTAIANAEFTVSAVASYNDKNVATGKTITAKYTLKFKASTNANFDNYSYNGSVLTADTVNTDESYISVTASTAGKITALGITVTGVNAKTFTYNGNTNVKLEAGTLASSGIISGDTVTFAINASVNDGTAASAASADAGTRAVTVTKNNVITLGGADAGNYTVTSVISADVVITRAEITITWPNVMTAEYTAESAAEALYKITVAGVAGGTAPSGAIGYTFDGAATVPTAVGVYTVEVTVSADTNYNQKTDTATLTITDNTTKLAFTVNGYGTKTYDGQSHNAVTLTNVVGFGETGFTYTVYYSKAASAAIPTEAYTDTSVWSTDATSVSKVAESGKYWYAVVAANYQTKTGSVTVTINAAELTIEGTPKYTTKVYNKTADAEVQNLALNGVMTSDASDISIEAVAVFNSANVAAANKITVTYTVTFANTDDMTNYKFTGTKTVGTNTWTVSRDTTGCTITPAPVTVTILTQTSVYNAQEPTVGQLEATNWTVTGTVYAGDVLGIALAKAVGVNAGEYAITGTRTNTNYDVTFENGTFTITPKEITVVIGNTSGIYGNTPSLPSTLLTTQDTLGTSEIATVRTNIGALETTATVTSDVGDTYTITVKNPAANGVYGNYKITFIGQTAGKDTGIYTVNKRAIELTANDLTTAYDRPLADFGYTITSGSLVNGDTLTLEYSTTAKHELVGDVWNTSDAGTYAITITSATVKNGAVAKDQNYNITLVGADYVVTPAILQYQFKNWAETQAAEYNVAYPNPVILKNFSSGRDICEANGNLFDGTVVYTSDDTDVATVDTDTGTVMPKLSGSSTVIKATITLKTNGNYVFEGSDTEVVISYTIAVGQAGAVRVNVGVLNGYELIDDAALRTFKAQNLITSAEATYPSSGVTFYYKLEGDTEWGAANVIPTATEPGQYVISIRAQAVGYGDFEATVTAYINELPTSVVTFVAGAGSITAGDENVFYKTGFLIRSDDFPTVAYTGRTFAGWMNASTGDVKSAADWVGTAVNGNITLIAQWTNLTLTATGIGSVTYTGMPLAPTVASVSCGTDVLTAEEDYTLIFTNNVNAGTNTGKIQIIGLGDYAGLSGSALFTINKADQTVTFENAGTVRVLDTAGTAENPAIAALDKANVTFTYSIGDETVATVNADTGVITILKAGKTTVTATAAATSNTNSGYATFELNVQMTKIVTPEDPEGKGGTVSNDRGLDYDTKLIITDNGAPASEIIASFISARNGGKVIASPASVYSNAQALELLKGKMILGSYEISLEEGSTTISIFEGIYTVRFKIDAQFKDVIAPYIVYFCNDGTIEVFETAKEIVTEDVGGVPTEVVYVTFKTTHFSPMYLVAKFPVTVEFATDSVIKTFGDASFTNAITVTPESDGTVTYESSDEAVVTVDGYGNVTIVGAGTATVTVRISDTDTYGSASASFTVTVNPKNISGFTASVITPAAEIIYNGGALTPEVTLADGTPLTAGVDYTVAFTNNVNADTATVHFTGIGNYTGSCTKEFTILPASGTQTVISKIPAQTYTGEQIKPVAVIKFNGKALTLGTDFTVAYGANVEAGTETGTLTITFIGNFSGEAECKFDIVKAISNFCVTVSDATFVYNGGAQYPTVVVTDFNKTLTPDVDYTISYVLADGTPVASPVNVGYYQIIVTGMGVYDNHVTTGGFAITPKLITAAFNTPTVFKVYGNGAFTNGVTVSDADAGAFTFVSSNVSVATVGSDGKVTIVGAGTTVITVYVAATENIAATQATFTLNVAKKNITGADFTVNSIETQYYTGKEVKAFAGISDNGTAMVEGRDYTLTFTNNVAIGQATVTVTGIGNYTGITTASFNIVANDGVAYEIADITETFIYDGTAKLPTPEVKFGGEVLTAGSDFDYVYLNNVNAGVASVGIVGKGEYTGVNGSVTFTILPKDISEITPEEIDAVTYTGAAQIPTAVIKVGETELTLGTDYVVAYGNNLNAGTATVTFTGIGNYTGSCETSFTINRKTLDASAVDAIADAAYTGSAIKPAIFARYNGMLLVEDIDFTATYANNINVGVASATVTFIGNYDGTASVEFNIVVNSNSAFEIADIEASIGTFTYDGTDKCPTPEVKFGNTVLVPGVDYEYEYSNNNNAGTATVAIVGKGDYAGLSGSVNFAILPRDISDLAPEAIDAVTYSGSAFTPDTVLKVGETALVCGTDYVVEYTENVNAGTATVILTGIGNYTGSCETVFTINAKALNASAIDGMDGIVYTGSAIKPAIFARYNGMLLVEGTDFTVAYSGNTNVGNAKAKVTFMGNYSGSADISFEILAKEITLDITVTPSEFIYNGANQFPTVKVTDGNYLLTEGKDYIVTVKQGNETVDTATDAGKYTVEIIGKGNYSGSSTLGSFTIKAADAKVEFSTAEIAKTFGDADFGVECTAESTGGARTFGSSNTAVATVGEDGTVKIVGVGTTVITVYASATGNYTAASATCTLTVAPKSIDGFALNSIDGQIYTGKAITVATVLKDGENVLTEGRDYTLAITDNVEIGTAKVTLTGIGNYTGSVNGTFEIIANAQNFEVTLEKSEYTRTGAEIKPVPTVKYAGRALTEGTDYKLSYQNNVHAGVATVTVNGMGVYQGATASVNFTINPTDVSAKDSDLWVVVESDNGFGKDDVVIIKRVDKDLTDEIKKAADTAKIAAANTAKAYETYTTEELAKLIKGKTAQMVIDVTLQNNGVTVTEFEGVYTVKFVIPEELSDVDNFQVVCVDADGNVEVYETVREGNVISFKTTHFSEFNVLGKRASVLDWLWLILLVAFVILALAAVIVILLLKNKKSAGKKTGSKKAPANN